MHQTFELVDFLLALGKSMRGLKKYLVGPEKLKDSRVNFKVGSFPRQNTAIFCCLSIGRIRRAEIIKIEENQHARDSCFMSFLGNLIIS